MMSDSLNIWYFFESHLSGFLRPETHFRPNWYSHVSTWGKLNHPASLEPLLMPQCFIRDIYPIHCLHSLVVLAIVVVGSNNDVPVSMIESLIWEGEPVCMILVSALIVNDPRTLCNPSKVRKFDALMVIVTPIYGRIVRARNFTTPTRAGCCFGNAAEDKRFHDRWGRFCLGSRFLAMDYRTKFYPTHPMGCCL